MEGLIFGGAYVRRAICVSKSIGLAYSRKEICRFCFVSGNFQVQALPPGGAYIWRGDLTEGFCVSGLGGLYLEGFIFAILRYVYTSTETSRCSII